MRPYLLGLTGSIGMGKSTTAAMFAEQGLPVWDADAAVARLYGPMGAALGPVAALNPAAVTPDGIDRTALKRWIAADPTALKRLEQVVHPLVAADRAAFIARQTADIVVLDIPLLFETGADATMDATLVVTAPPAVQRQRVLARPGMTEAQFQTLLARQMPDAEKQRRATYVIETTSLEAAQKAVQDVINRIRGRHA
jgi:dephospho-CoA kinase